MATINTNMAANIAANSMTRNERSMSSTMERLSTGLRINSAKDDAAGLAISSKMTSQINGLNQAVRNSNDAISMIQVAEGAMKEVTNMFQRMRELAVQAISDSNTSADRTALDNEYKQLSAEVQRVAGNTQWNGTNILDGARTQTTFQIGANASQTIDVNFGTLATNGATVATTNTARSTSTAAFVELTFGGTALADGDVISMNFADGGRLSITLGTGDAAHIAAGEVTNAHALAFETTGAGYSATKSATGFFTDATAGNASANLVIAVGSAANKLKITGSNVASANQLLTPTNITVSRGTHAAVANTDITASDHAAAALGVLDTAITNVNSTRAGLGASMSRLEYASDNLQNVSQNTASARSRVMDADYAAETTELARTQIIQQASTAMLAQANQSQQAILALLGA
jgi:flagellin